ncbi:MAG: type II toxin-antitoxin system VapC family toxin [Solirubrobacteraceae bacterium]
MAALILDASVLIGLLDTADAHHQRAVDDVEGADRTGNTLLAPASAYSEALVSFARAGRTADARQAIAAMGITIVAMSQEIAERAAEIRAQHDRLRLPDAIVLATARELRADLLTYDKTLTKIATQT